MAKLGLAAVLVVAIVAVTVHELEGAIPGDVQRKINMINKNGPYIGLVIPNTFEMNPLLESDSFTPNKAIPTLDFAGRRFRFGSIEGRKVILVMTGLSMTNAAVTTQLLLALFRIEGVVHYGIAGNANPSLNIGDVTIARYWGHSGLWNWQRYGDGPENELSLESNGDYTREFGFLKFSDYNVGLKDNTNKTSDNLLNNLWYQPEEVFPVDGTPEERQHIFWVPVDATYFAIAKQLEGVELENCLNVTTCLSHVPKVTTVLRGTSANIFLDNAAYRNFIYSKFDVSPVEMESAAVALICHQQRVPHITIRALSDLAGGGSTNEADTFTFLAVTNCIKVVLQFIKSLGPSHPSSLRGYRTF